MSQDDAWSRQIAFRAANRLDIMLHAGTMADEENDIVARAAGYRVKENFLGI